MTKPISREYRIYLALWRKAVLNPDQLVTVNLPNYSLALSTRMSMYRAILPFRKGLIFDEELSLASERFVIFVVKGPDKAAPHQVVFRPRLTLQAIEAEFGALGLSENDLLLFDEKFLDAEFTASITNLPPKNPFYSREED